MRFIKISLIVLVVAIITDLGMAEAKFDVYTYFEIPAGKTAYSDSYAKKDESNQTYTNNNTATTITSPCPNCKIGVKGISTYHGTTTVGITKAGETAYLENSGYVDTYYLQATRIDYTAVRTKTGGTWHICT